MLRKVGNLVVVLGAVLIFLLGAGILIGTAIYNAQPSTILDGMPTAKLVVFACLYAFSILILFMAVSGLAGIRKQSRWLLSCYSVSNIVLAVFGVGFGVVCLVYLPTAFNNSTCSTSGSNFISTFIPTFNQQYSLSYTKFGTASCPALYNGAAGFGIYSAAQQAQLLNNGYVYTTVPSATALVSAISECTQLKSVYAVTLSTIEFVLSCSGMCLSTASPQRANGYHYVFSNVNNGVPKGSCYSAMVTASATLGNLVGGVCLGVGLLFTLNLVVVVWICCGMKGRKEEEARELLKYGDYELQDSSK